MDWDGIASKKLNARNQAREQNAHAVVSRQEKYKTVRRRLTMVRERWTRFVWASPQPTTAIHAVDSHTQGSVPRRPSVSTSSISLDLIETPASPHNTMPGRTRPIDKLAAAVGKCSTEVCRAQRGLLLGSNADVMQSAVYGKCIFADYNNVHKDMCAKEFMKLKECYLVSVAYSRRKIRTDVLQKAYKTR